MDFVHKDILILSWLDEQMRFLHGKNGETAATWECPGNPEDLGNETFKLSPVLRTAVERTGYKGRDVGLVLDHAKLAQQLLSTPPAKGRDLELYIQRQVDQLKVVDESVIMSWMETEPIKTSKGLVLFLFPKALQEKLIAECRDAGLNLVILVAPTVLLRSELSKLSIRDGEIGMVAALSGRSTAVVIGGNKGALFLARSLRCNWNDSKARLNSELNRSTIFLRQQYGKDVDTIWLTGDGADTHAEQMRLGADANGKPMRSGADLPVNVSPTASSYFWAEQLMRLTPETEANLINSEQRTARRRRMFVSISGGMIALLFLLSFAIVVLIELLLHYANKELAALEPHAAILNGQKGDLEQQFEGLDAKKELTRLIQEQRLPPVPGWFLDHLSTILPSELVLTKVQVHRVDNLTKEEDKDSAPLEGVWKAQLVGAGIVTSESKPTQVKAAFKEFIEELQAGPFYLSFTNVTKHFAPRSVGAWIATDGSATTNSNEFIIEGVMGGNTIR